MHPYIAQSLIDARVADRQRAAAATREARQSRRAARRAHRHGAAVWSNPQPALEALPGPVPDRALTR